MDPSAKLVRDALERLHDVPYLQTHPLADAAGGGRALQRKLLAAIEALGGEEPNRGRAHRLLVLRYVDALPAPAIQRELGLAKTQYYEDHARAVAAVASLVDPARSEPVADARRAPSHNLPAQLTSFVGREKEVAAIRDLLSASRLVTLTGTGGGGKTRLALQVASDVVGCYPDGVWFVDLAPLAAEELIPQALLSVLGVHEALGRPPLETLVDRMRTRDALLLLDNCEHLLGTVAGVAEALLRGCPGLSILATSRELLDVAGETPWRVPSLSAPDPGSPLTPEELAGYEAVDLFVQRARAVVPSFALTSENADPVAQICRSLDGIPLAIELAAARLRLLTVREIADRLDDRFALLSKGGRTALRRQQTLRALVDWSYELLSQPERILFRRLSVFSGGWRLVAVETICSGCGLEPGEVLDVLAGLVDKSLVVAEETADGTRYRYLETIRVYALERLADAGEVDDVRRRHAEWYLAWSEAAEPELVSRDQALWLARVETEHDNLRAAIEWAVRTAQPELELRLVAAVAHFWQLRGYAVEGRTRLADALARDAGTPSAARARALDWLGTLFQNDARIGDARRCLEESAAVATAVGDHRAAVFARRHLGQLLHSISDGEEALGMLRDVLATARAVGDHRATGQVLVWLAGEAWRAGDEVEAERMRAEAYPILETVGDNEAMANWYRLSGMLALHRGRFDEARLLYLESLRLVDSMSFAQAGVASRLSLGNLARIEGNTQEALGWFRRGLVMARDRVGVTWAFHCLRSVAGMWRRMGDAEDAARLFGAERSARPGNVPFAGRAFYEEDLAALRATLGDAAFETAWAAGARMTLEETIAFALEHEPCAPHPARHLPDWWQDSGPSRTRARRLGTDGRPVECAAWQSSGRASCPPA
jgi:predicted ATPase